MVRAGRTRSRLLCLALLVFALLPAAGAEASSGVFELAWGKNIVQTGGPGDTMLGGAEKCTVASTCQVGVAGSAAGELSSPFAVGADSAGNVYVADLVNQRIDKYDSNGVFLRAWGKNVVVAGPDEAGTGFEKCIAGTGDVCGQGSPGTLGGEIYPNGVAVDSVGNVYVTDTVNRRIQKFDSSGTFLRAWGKDVIAGGPVGFEICTSAPSCKEGEAGVLQGELVTPVAIGIDGSDRVHVTDVNNARVQVYDVSGNPIRAYGRNVVDAGQPGDTISGGFEICTYASAALCRTGMNGAGAGEFNTPTGISLDAAGNAYVGDGGNARVQKFDPSGNFLRLWGRDVVSSGPDQTGTGFEKCIAGSGDVCKTGTVGGLGGELSSPAGTAVDPSGNVYVSETNNHRVTKFDPDGSFLLSWGRDVDAAGGSGSGEICTSAANCQQGNFSTALGGEFRYPSGVASGPNGQIYVVDGDNLRVQKFTADPSPPPPPAGGPTTPTPKKCKKGRKLKKGKCVKKKRRKK